MRISVPPFSSSSSANYPSLVSRSSTLQLTIIAVACAALFLLALAWSRFTKLKTSMTKRTVAQQRALNRYKINQVVSDVRTTMDRKIIFGDIKSIRDIERLLKEVSDSQSIDLAHHQCQRCVVDIFNFCDKETCSQLTQWLNRQSTFHISLLVSCLKVFVEKDSNRSPISYFALQELLFHYKEKLWHQTTDSHRKILLSSNDPRIISAMGILIQYTPNDNRTMELARWFMQQPNYNDSKARQEWMKILEAKMADHQAEENKRTGGRTLSFHYPLYNALKN
jgi:hypothetical protein